MESEYEAIASLRMTVPFAARGNGLVGSVTIIISLNILPNDGAEAFASSTMGLLWR